MSSRAPWWSLSLLMLSACGPGAGPDPTKLALRGSVNATTPGVFGVAASGSHAFVNTTYGSMVVALGDGTSPSVVAEFESAPRVFDRARATALSQGHFYSAHSSRVDIIDVSTPSAPRAVGQLVGMGLIVDLEVVGSRLYLADETLGVSAWDLSNPGAPTKVADVSTGATQGFAANASHVFVARSGFLTIYSVSGATFTEVGSMQFTPGSGPVDLDLAGDRLFVSGNVYLGVYDVKQPAAPAMLTPAGVGVVATGSGQNGTPAGSSYYAARTRGLEVYDVSAPAEWKLVATLEPPRPTHYDVAVLSNQVLVAHEEGLFVFGAP